MEYEYWWSVSDDFNLFIPKDEHYERKIAMHHRLKGDLVLMWSCEAESRIDAEKQKNKYLSQF